MQGKPPIGERRLDCAAAQPARASGVGTPEFNAREVNAQAGASSTLYRSVSFLY